MNLSTHGPKYLNILFSHRTRGSDVESVHIKGMADAFMQFGHRISFISPFGVKIYCNDKKNNKKTKYFLGWSLISRFCPQLLFEIMELLYNLFLYFRLSNEVKKQSVDFIYERYALNTFATVLFAKRHNIPIILEVNDATGISRVRHHKAEFIARYIEKWVFVNCSAIATISSEFQRILRQRVNEKGKVTFVSNAIDPIAFNPNLYDNQIRERLGDDKIIVGFIGSFAFWHGIELLADVIPDVIKKIPNVHFLLVGSGVRFQKIKSFVEEKRLEKHVTLTGKVPPNKVPVYLKAMDVGVIPNSNTYGSPMKLFEYMAMGVAPVAPILPPILDAIEDGVTGVLFQQNSAASLKEKLVFICQNEDVRKQISYRARATILDRHLWVHNAEHVLNIYYNIAQPG